MFNYPPPDEIKLDRRALLDRAWLHLSDLKLDPDNYLYFYVALDLRFFIESLLMDVLSGASGESLGSSEKNAHRANEFVQVLEMDGASVAEISKRSLGFSIAADELRELVILYGQLGALLHLQTKGMADQTSWQGRIDQFVGDAYKSLERLYRRSHEVNG